MRTISFLSMKGGTGKTHITLNLAVGLAIAGYRVLVVDLDPQGNLTSYFIEKHNRLQSIEIPDRQSTLKERVRIMSDAKAKNPNDFEAGSYEVLLRTNDIKDCIYPTYINNLDICPSVLDKMIKANKAILLDVGRRQENRIKRALKDVRKDYDFVLIDNPPTSDTLTINALYASDMVVIPIKPGDAEIDGFTATMNDMFTTSEDFEFDIYPRIIFTMFHLNKERNVMRKNEALILEKFKMFDDIQFKTIIRYQDSPVLNNSLERTPVINQKHNISEDYRLLVKEFIDLMEE